MSEPATRPGGAKSQTIERAVLVLSCFTPSTPHLSLNDLAERLELNPSTVYRYVSTLQAAGLIERDPERRGYRLGLGVVELAGIALNQLDVRKEALDEMDRVRDDTQLIVNLAVLFDGDVLHVAHSAPSGWPRWKTTPGRRAVAHCTALGKVLLAHSSWESVVDTIERKGWRPYTVNSIRDFDRLRDELETARELGHARDDEERADGITCLAVPIRDHSGRVVAALSVSGTTRRLRKGNDEATAVLIRATEAANRVSVRLGGTDIVTYF